jgi:translation initiation factor 4A
MTSIEKNENDDHDDHDSIQVYESFDSMNLNEDILRGIYTYGFEKPSEIQKRGICAIKGGRDIIGQAQSGTGKTGTFTIGVLESIDINVLKVQGLILAPTRELARQIYNIFIEFSKYTNIKVSLLIGGGSISDDINNIRNGIHIVIGTPGRILDVIKREIINPKHIKIFVLDEADEMLSYGFKDQIKNIFVYLPNKIQTCLFSATMPQSIIDLANNFIKNPLRILVKSEELTLEGIKQFYIALDQDTQKFETLCDLYESISISQAIIYCNTRKKVDWLATQLQMQDFAVSSIHGDMMQSERNSIMNDFRSNSTRILITTDILARGIDIQQVSIVINYDLPCDCETYIHRIGRGGRFGRKGLAINLITKYNVEMLKNLERYYCTQIEEMPIDISNFINT